MKILSLLAEGQTQSDFITKVFPVLRYVLFGIIALSAIILIVAILLQSNSNDSGNVLAGTQESYYSQNKGSTKDGKLKIITIVMASVIAVCALLYFITEIVNKTV